MKIWVDDRDGAAPKLKPDVYRAIITEAHGNGQEVLAHLGRTSGMEDAKDLFRAGIDGFVHTVRDRDVDQEYLDLVRAHPKVWTGPNVPGPGMTANDLASLRETLPSSQIEKMRQDIEQSRAAGNKAAVELFMLHCRNLRRIHDAGMTIGLGTDGTGNGFGAHEQLAFYTQCGMSPREAIVAATGTNARLLHLEKLGTIAAGKEASFIVLDANPLDDILNTRRISTCTPGQAGRSKSAAREVDGRRTSGRNSRCDRRRREARCSSSSGSRAPSSTTTAARSCSDSGPFRRNAQPARRRSQSPMSNPRRSGRQRAFHRRSILS